MSTTISLNPEHINHLDLSPVVPLVQEWLQAGKISHHEQELQFQIHYPLDSEEELEFSEISEVRLWFIRLDTVYPWMPYLLDWRSGELVRYAAMLVPHQFSRKEGIQFNPQALDIFIMQKVFVLMGWLQSQGISSESKLKSMAEIFGYELNSGLFELLHTYPALKL